MRSCGIRIINSRDTKQGTSEDPSPRRSDLGAQKTAYSRHQKVGIWAWDDLCWFSFFLLSWDQGTGHRRILHFGPKAQDKVGFRKPWSVRSLCLYHSIPYYTTPHPNIPSMRKTVESRWAHKTGNKLAQ